MDKNTLVAVVLSVVVITVGFFIQAMLTTTDEGVPPTSQVETRTQQTETRETQPAETAEREAEEEIVQESQEQTTPELQEGEIAAITAEGEAEPVQREIHAQTDVFDITFSTEGAVIQSLKLRKHQNENRLVDMLFRKEMNRAAFEISFGGPNAKPVDTLYHFQRPDENTFVFYRDFLAPSQDGNGGVPFRLKKTFLFKPGEYLFRVKITIENSINEVPVLNKDGNSYTLYFGPQIGPRFQELDRFQRREYRKFYIYSDGSRDEVKVSGNGTATVQERFLWAGIVGKYFTVIGVPDATKYDLMCRQQAAEGIPQTAEMFFSRPPLQSSKNTDVFHFYAGPKLGNTLTAYNRIDKNAFEVKDLNLDVVADRSKILGWLVSILKFFLELFYKVVPNYGVAIIMLTILIKLILFPITRKSYESTSKMQALSPKINEIRTKYKDKPDKMNKEMAALYKKEGVSPLGGCLPMLLQLPVFIALYQLLNTHFDLRGAEFIAPWITDLSGPESIWNFAPFQLPILGWSDLRLLPIIFVGTQLLSSKLMQTPQASSQGNMKMITYMLPIVFFFVLYDVPSGLLLYWISTNILTVLQQRIIAKRRASEAT